MQPVCCWNLFIDAERGLVIELHGVSIRHIFCFDWCGSIDGVLKLCVRPLSSKCGIHQLHFMRRRNLFINIWRECLIELHGVSSWYLFNRDCGVFIVNVCILPSRNFSIGRGCDAL